MIVGIDNITPGTSTSSTLSIGSMRPYIQDLLLGLPALFPEWTFKFFTPAWNEPFEIRHPNVEIVICRGAARSRFRRVWFEQAKLPGVIAREKLDIWLGTCNYLPLRAHCRTLLLIQSHQFFTHPQAYGTLRRIFLRWIVSRSVRSADRIGVQCHDARRTLLRYVDVPEDSVSVVYNRLVDFKGVAETAPALTRRPYILYISGLYLFKNHPRLIEAFSRIRDNFPDLALVIAGGDAEGRKASDLRAVASKNGVASDVIFLGNVAPTAVSGLYRNARASAFPSLEETFGLPILEAMSLGCPVLTSNLSSMAEIAGDAALLVDPRSVDSIARGLTAILTDESLRTRLIEKGRARAGLFTRQKTLAALAAALADLPPSTGSLPSGLH